MSDRITDGIVGVADRWPNSVGVGHGQRYECKRRAQEGVLLATTSRVAVALPELGAGTRGFRLVGLAS